jgi:hypothetical protein
MLDTLDMTKYNPRVSKITTRLHLFHQVHPGSGAHLRHPENKHLLRVRALTQKLVLLNVGLMATTSKHGDAVHDPKSAYLLERSHVVLNTWRSHVLEVVKNRD